MPDNFGAINVPLEALPDDQSVSDPFLSITLGFLKAWLETDGAAVAAWDIVGVAPGQRVINGLFDYNPNDPRHLFSEKDLPALFMWRDGDSTDEWIADDWEVETSTIKLVWVFPIAPSSTQSKRAPFVNGLAKAIKIGLERGRTPAFKILNDPEYQSGSLGSLFYPFAGVMSIRSYRHRAGEVRVEQIPDARNKRPPPPRRYAALEMTFQLEELMEFGLDRYDQPTGQGDTTITINGGPQKVEGRP